MSTILRAERIVWIELLRIVAVFTDIVLHVATKGWKNADLYLFSILLTMSTNRIFIDQNRFQHSQRREDQFGTGIGFPSGTAGRVQRENTK